MKYLKANWLSIIAIAISAISLCSSFIRCEPFIFTDQLLTWIWTGAIGIIGIASAIALGGQIYSAMTIDKRINERIKTLQDQLAIKIMELDDKSFHATYSMSMYVMGQYKALIMQYSDPLNCFVQAIKHAKIAKKDQLCEIYSNQILNFLKKNRNVEDFKISKDEKIQYIQDLENIPNSSIIIHFILELPTL